MPLTISEDDLLLLENREDLKQFREKVELPLEYGSAAIEL